MLAYEILRYRATLLDADAHKGASLDQMSRLIARQASHIRNLAVEINLIPQLADRLLNEWLIELAIAV